MMNLAILNGYRQLPQATGLNYSIVNDTARRRRSLGWPTYENSNMERTLTGAAADYLVLSGDFQQFAIVDRVGTTIEVSPTWSAPTAGPGARSGFLHALANRVRRARRGRLPAHQLQHLMPARKYVIAKRTFGHLDGDRNTALQEGERLPASSPIVKAQPERVDPESQQRRKR